MMISLMLSAALIDGSYHLTEGTGAHLHVLRTQRALIL